MDQEAFEAVFVPPAEGVLAMDASNQARSDFIAMISHELRTPLNAVNGFLSIVLSEQAGKLNERQREFLGYAHESTEHLLLLVEDILLLSRADLRQLELQCAGLALPEMIAQALRRVGPAASQAGITLQGQLPPRFPRLWADATLLEQVLANLLHHALKVTPPGGSITIHARRVDDMAEINVTDTGSGVPLAEQPRIFGRFYQPEDALLVAYGGFGLGLTVARVIVEQHSGRIWLQSEPGRGSTISFTLPLVQPPRPPTRSSREAGQ